MTNTISNNSNTQNQSSNLQQKFAQNFMITIPHSGEQVPDETPWLKTLPEEILMCDVDRFVDRLYEPALAQLQIPYVKTQWHRYAGDLNRLPDDVDAGSVLGHKTAEGPFLRGFHWVITTLEYRLMAQPMPLDTHQKLVQKIYDPFHADVKKLAEKLKQSSSVVYHLDAHSMPSVGTAQHRDPGERRADVVVSDSLGKSCSKAYRDLVIAAYVTAGFKVGYNWPYMGGRLTEQYGRPDQQHHTIQVELNRDLYMNEQTKKLKDSHKEVQKKIEKALTYILQELPSL